MLVNEQILEVQGSLGGEQIDMTVDESQLAHIMSILTNVYSDKIGSVIREYSTNALDSHIESGQKAPVEITTPTALSPYFIVRDYGLGMSSEDIRNIYSKYGTSTKRNSESQNGKFGIGCKSALTYCDQFTLTGIKDGIKTLVAIGRTANGGGTMEIVHTGPTDEPNGVTVKIPVNNSYDRSEFETKAHKFARYVSDDDILVNRKVVKFDAIKVSDVFYQNSTRDYHSQPLVVMGNVAYPVASGYLNNTLLRDQFVYFAEMGEVDFPPSREELMYTERTKATLDRIEKEYEQEIKNSVQSEIDACTTMAEAWNAQRKIQVRYNNYWTFTWQNTELPSQLSFTTYKWDYSGDRSASTIDDYAWDSPDKNRTVVLHNFKNKSFNKWQGLKITRWLTENHPDYCEIGRAIKIEDIDEEHRAIFDECVMVDWDEARKMSVEDMKPAKKPKAAKKERSWYNFNKEFRVPDSSKDIYYGKRDVWGWRDNDLLMEAAECIFVTDNNLPILLKKYPNAQPAKVLANKVVKDWVDSLTKDDIKALESHAYFSNSWMLDPDKIDDPDLALLVRSTSIETKPGRNIYETHRKMSNLIYYVDVSTKIPELGSKGENILEPYPILNNLSISKYSFNGTDHNAKKHIQDYMLEYVNNVYKETKNGKIHTRK